MITVTWDAAHCRLTLRGHAGDGEYGNNAVCAAASILAYTLADGLRELAEKEQLSCTAVLEPGYARLHCRDKHPKVQALFRTVTRGYRLLSHACPNQVSYRA